MIESSSEEESLEIDNSGEVTVDPSEEQIYTQRTIVYPSFSEDDESDTPDFTQVEKLSEHFSESVSISKKIQPSVPKKQKISETFAVHGAGHVTIQSANRVINLTLPDSMGPADVAKVLKNVFKE